MVKVLRPGIDKIICRDIELLYINAHLAERYWKEGSRLRPVEVVAALKAQGVSMHLLGERGVKIFFTQVFTLLEGDRERMRSAFQPESRRWI